ncbi:MAG: PEGA domain-containing protein [Dehalococcoidia bacterium]|nr:PEGA domain-containing protein [Dehalococcoidia bacterium]
MRKVVFTFIVVAVVLVCALVGFQLVKRRAPRNTVTISSRPAGATIHLDGEGRGITPQTLKLSPGEHTVTLSLEHYAPWQAQVTLDEGEAKRVDASLSFIPYTVALSGEGGATPVWSQDGRLIYYVRSLPAVDGIVQVTLDSLQQKVIASIPGSLLGTHAFSPDRGRVLATSAVDENGELLLTASILSVHEIASGRRIVLSNRNDDPAATYRAAWRPDGKAIVFTRKKVRITDQTSSQGIRPIDTELVMSSPDKAEDQIVYVFAMGEIPTYLAWAPEGPHVVVQTLHGIMRLNVTESTAELLVESPDIVHSAWSPNGDRIAYLVGPSEASLEASIWVIESDGIEDAKQLVSGAISGFQWKPDGRSVLYFADSSTEDGSSCWAVDVETGERTLLADPGILRLRVGDFAVSPDGRRIAFEGEDGNIWLLVLDETREPQGLLDGLSEWWNLLR